MAASKTFIVERGPDDKIEVKAEKAVQADDSSRITFYDGDNAVASFINIQGWYEKPATK